MEVRLLFKRGNSKEQARYLVEQIYEICLEKLSLNLTGLGSFLNYMKLRNNNVVLLH